MTHWHAIVENIQNLSHQFFYFFHELNQPNLTHQDVSRIFAPFDGQILGEKPSKSEIETRCKVLSEFEAKVSAMKNDPEFALLFDIEALAASAARAKQYTWVVSQGVRDDSSLFARLPGDGSVAKKILAYASGIDPDSSTNNPVQRTIFDFYGTRPINRQNTLPVVNENPHPSCSTSCGSK